MTKGDTPTSISGCSELLCPECGPDPIRSGRSVCNLSGRRRDSVRGRQEPAIHVNESIPTYLLAPHTSPHDAVRAAASSHSDAISSGVMRAPAVDETLAAAAGDATEERPGNHESA